MIYNFRHTTSDTAQGQSLVEFAFGMMVLLILLVGIVDGGRALFTYMALRDAAQEGAVYASVSDPKVTTDIHNRIHEALETMVVDPNDVNIELTWDGPACLGGGISIRTTLPNFPITMPFLGAIIGSQTVPISAEVTDTVLRPTCP